MRKLRIFQVIEASANRVVKGNRTWYRNLYEPLVEMGHDVVLVPAEPGGMAMQTASARLRAQFSNQVLATFRKESVKQGFDLFFSYLMTGMIDVDVIDEIRRSGVPTCNFSCNNTHQFDLVADLSSHFDLNLHAEKHVREKFVAVGARPFWWPMASNPKYFRPYPLERDVPVSFVGANYGRRAQYVTHLLAHGVDVHAFGPGWLWGASSRWRSHAKRWRYIVTAAVANTPKTARAASAALADHDLRRSLTATYVDHVHPPVTDSDLVALYSRSRITLGFLEVYDGHDPGAAVAQHLHLRDFEAPMSRALHCTGHMDEIEDMYEVDKEVLVYRNEHELLDKVRYYLAHPGAADQIRDAGYLRSLRDHTYERRFNQLFAVLGLLNATRLSGDRVEAAR
jgi:spore maturation protein CgeB